MPLFYNLWVSADAVLIADIVANLSSMSLDCPPAAATQYSILRQHKAAVNSTCCLCSSCQQYVHIFPSADAGRAHVMQALSRGVAALVCCRGVTVSPLYQSTNCMHIEMRTLKCRTQDSLQLSLGYLPVATTQYSILR